MNLQENYKRLFKGKARSNDSKLINEAIVNLPKNIAVRHTGKQSYSLQYSEYDWEPSVPDLEKYSAMLQQLISKMSTQLGVTKRDNTSSVYVAQGDVAVGIGFKSSIDPATMQNAVNNFHSRDED